MTVTALFPTLLYASELDDAADLLEELRVAGLSIAQDDEAGQAWCIEYGYPGYTSYASLADLAWRDPAFEQLERRLRPHASAFAAATGFDLGDRPLELDSLWINVLDPGGFHSGHIHPRSVISGTLYLDTPEGASSIRFEDPRLPLMMNAPPRAKEHPQHVTLKPRKGMVLLWESWLRHEVTLNEADDFRVSVSFNYRW